MSENISSKQTTVEKMVESRADLLIRTFVQLSGIIAMKIVTFDIETANWFTETGGSDREQLPPMLLRFRQSINPAKSSWPQVANPKWTWEA